MKKLLLTGCFLFIAGLANAFAPVRYVQISTNTLSQQTGNINIQGATISTTTVSSATVTNLNATGTATLATATISSGTALNFTITNSTATSLTVTGALVSGGTISISSGVATNFTVTNATITNLTATNFSASTLQHLVVATIQSTTTATTSTTSSAYTITGSSAIITPVTNTHKIRIMVNGGITNADPVATNCFVTVERGAVDIGPGNGTGFCRNGGGGTNAIVTPCFISYLDSPASGSSLTYQIYIKSSDNSHSCIWNESNPLSVMQLDDYVY